MLTTANISTVICWAMLRTTDTWLVWLQLYFKTNIMITNCVTAEKAPLSVCLGTTASHSATIFHDNAKFTNTSYQWFHWWKSLDVWKNVSHRILNTGVQGAKSEISGHFCLFGAFLCAQFSKADRGSVVRSSVFGRQNFRCRALDLQLLLWVSHPLQVNQLGQLSLACFRRW